MEEFFVEVPDIFRNPTSGSVRKWLETSFVSNAVSLFPISSDRLMYFIHQYYIERELNQTFQETKDIQAKIKSLLPLLPDGKCISNFIILRVHMMDCVRIGMDCKWYPEYLLVVFQIWSIFKIIRPSILYRQFLSSLVSRIWMEDTV